MIKFAYDSYLGSQGLPLEVRILFLREKYSSLVASSVAVGGLGSHPAGGVADNGDQGHGQVTTGHPELRLLEPAQDGRARKWPSEMPARVHD